MNFFQLLLKYKILGSCSLIFAAIYMIITRIGDEKFYLHLAWTLTILLFGLIQLYDSFFLKRNPKLPSEGGSEEGVNDKNETNPLIKEKYPVIQLCVKELDKFNGELDPLTKDKEPNHKQLLYQLRNKIKNILINLKFKNII